MISEHDVRLMILKFFEGHIHPGAEHLSNDGAAIPLTNLKTLAVSADSFVSGVDFKPLWGSLFQAGQRAIRQNLSDLAAMGALPLGFTWSLEISDDWLQSTDNLSLFLKGAASICAQHHLKLLGGDLGTRSEGLGCHVTIMGQLTSHALTRHRAKAGDTLWVSGQLGESHLGLRLLQQAEQDALFVDEKSFQKWKKKLSVTQLQQIHRHLQGHDEITLGHQLVDIASSCIDISDGLSTDLQRICDASHVGAIIHADALAGNLDMDNFQERFAVLHGGENFVLLFTVPPHLTSKVQALKAQGFQLTQIGQMNSHTGKILMDRDGKEVSISPQGWDAFCDTNTRD